ncbi:MAG: tetratricopeptide repeat protein [Sedimentisphaerales bacterium]|nr:tetratricopeptide repeat protein [Sedimentisphaerales bacterium]
MFVVTGDTINSNHKHLSENMQADRSNPEAIHSLGIMEYQKGRFDRAVDFIKKAIEADNQKAQYYNTLGIALEAIGEFNEAFLAYQRAITIEPDYAEAYHNMAVAFQSQGQYVSAVEKCRIAISLRPDFAQAYNTMAYSLEKQKLYDEAIENYRHAIRLKPNYVEAYNHLGVVLNEQGSTLEAIDYFKLAIQYDPYYAEIHNNLGIALKEQMEFDEAIVCFEKALQLDPDFVEAHYNLGNSLRDEGRCEEAISNYRQAICLDPDYAKAHWNLSLTLLLKGDYLKGWEGYKWRRNADLKVVTDYHRTGKPRWDGSSFESQRLLVHYEQGLGDNIQFARYLPMVKARGGTVIFETLKPLIGILQGFPGVDELVEYNPSKKLSSEYDVYASLLDMPYIFGTTIETIPAPVPYIYADPSKAEYWRKILAGPDYKVGIVWAGSPEHGNDRYRSCSLKCFAPLAAIEGLKLYGLQKGRACRQMEEFAGEIAVTNISKHFDDFTDTAAAIENLDLVISVDTSVLHLSGAMGKPTWALIPYAPEWRWMLDRRDSPWYPTMRLFRQERWGDWDSVFRHVADELRLTVQRKGCK